MLGITGTKLASVEDNKENFENLRQISYLPIVICFGIQDPNQANQFKKMGVDGVVIGSTIVKEMSEKISFDKILANVEKKVAEFSKAIKS
jgi:tryptophan synthase alpha subunit